MGATGKGKIMASKIAWTDKSWQPVVGCTKVSPGCDNCYAERMAKRLAAIEHPKLEAGMGGKYNYVINTEGKWSNKAYCDESSLDKPLHWRKGRRIFVCSMGDLFHESVPFNFIDKVVDVFRQCPQHTGILLTKRHERLLEYSKRINHEWLDNIIGMVTAENQKWADTRIPALLQCGFKTTGVSIEPMLGPVDLEFIKDHSHPCGRKGLDFPKWERIYALSGERSIMGNRITEEKLDWVIAGAETGSGKRYCDIENVRSLVGQCKEAGTPVFVKQLHGPKNDRGGFETLKLKSQFPADLRIREYPK